MANIACRPVEREWLVQLVGVGVSGSSCGLLLMLGVGGTLKSEVLVL